MSTAPALDVGSTFGPYRIEAVLGRGGMGVVYRAEQVQLGRSVALKLLSPELAADDDFRARFLRESRLMAVLEHPNIVPVYDAGEIEGRLFIAMRYVEGEDLATLLEATGRLPAERAIALIAQLAAALDAAHARGLVHRDVKPSNALVAGDRAYLVDFGITHDPGAEPLTDTGEFLGTVDYLAPERIRGDPVDGRADVYSLGCVLFECLTGRVPFPSTSAMAGIYAHLEQEPPRAREERPDLPAALDPVVARALAKDPGDRYPTAGALAAAAEEAVAPPAATRDRRRAAALVTVVGLLAAAAIVLALTFDGGSAAPEPAGAGAVLALNARSGRVADRLPAGDAPTALSVDGRRLWMVDAQDRTVRTIDSRSRSSVTTATGATPVDVVSAHGGVWVANGVRQPGVEYLGPTVNEVAQLDPANLRQTASAPLPISDRVPTGENRMAATAGAVWAIAATGEVTRIDPASATPGVTSGRFKASAIATGRGGLWAVDDAGNIARIDTRTGRARRLAHVPDTYDLDTVAADDRAVWAASNSEGKLWRVGYARGSVPGSVDIGAGATDLVTTPGAVWIANSLAGTVQEVDATTMRVVREIEVGGSPHSLATDGRTVWVAVTGTAPATRSDVSGVTPLSQSTCDPVIAGGGGRADLLVAADLPLLGDTRLSARQMAEAMTYELRRRGFRAGRFRIAFQACNDALASTGVMDAGTCAANARAFGRDADVVAVIGSFNSGCTEAMLPTLNRARPSPVPMISPVNSSVDLTRSGSHVESQQDLGRFYPTGRRNFVRVFPPDDLQGVAFARFVHDRGRRRSYVVDDGYSGYSDLIAKAFARTGRRLHMRVVGRERIKDLQGPRMRDLVDRIARRRPDAILVSAAALGPVSARLLGQLRTRFGAGADVLAIDALGPASGLLQLGGRAVRGTFLAAQGVPIDRLPPEGRRFAAGFARTQPGAEIEPTSVYAAQAADTLLDAVARSDGTRRSVNDELFRTNAPAGIIGPVRFNGDGDVEQSSEEIVRVTGRGGPVSSFWSLKGATTARILHVGPGDAR
jgi:serine/threonine-protein kinase